jgi:hypothetical protein
MRLELLEVRDELIAAQAELGEASGRIQFLDSQLSRYRTASEQLDKFTRSPVWKVYGPYESLRRRAGARLRRVLGRFR